MSFGNSTADLWCMVALSQCDIIANENMQRKFSSVNLLSVGYYVIIELHETTV